MEQTLDRRRVRISTTIDPDLLEAVDLFVADNPAFNRSRVFDEALRLWQGQQLERALEAQYAGPLSQEEEEEQAAWRRIRRAAAQRVLERSDDR